MNFSMVTFILAMFFGTVENSTRSELAGTVAKVLVGIAAITFVFGIVGMFAAAKH